MTVTCVSKSLYAYLAEDAIIVLLPLFDQLEMVRLRKRSK